MCFIYGAHAEDGVVPEEGLAMQLGFVDTGTMGNPMAQCLMAAGHQLTVYDLRREATTKTPAGICSNCATLPGNQACRNPPMRRLSSHKR